MIKIENITIKKGHKWIVKNSSFEIKPGEITVVLGKNGAGKSTLLEAVTGANSIESGQILWDGELLKSMEAKTLATRRAVLSQKVNIPFSIPVNELVEMGTYASPNPLTKNQTKILIQEALELVGMTNFIHRDFTSLSGGEQKRVLFAKCIVQLKICPQANINQYLFLDEPTASLDIEQQYLFIELVKQFVKKQNIGVFAVLHDINLAAQFADKLIMMQDGKIVKTGNPDEILIPKNIRQVYNIDAIVQEHPIYGCPLVTTLPNVTNYVQHTM